MKGLVWEANYTDTRFVQPWLKHSRRASSVSENCGALWCICSRLLVFHVYNMLRNTTKHSATLVIWICCFLCVTMLLLDMCFVNYR